MFSPFCCKQQQLLSAYVRVACERQSTVRTDENGGEQDGSGELASLLVLDVALHPVFREMDYGGI